MKFVCLVENETFLEEAYCLCASLSSRILIWETHFEVGTCLACSGRRSIR